MSLDSRAIAKDIAALEIAGVTIKDIDAIPESVIARDCPILIPDPDGWMAGSNIEPENGQATFTSGGMWNFSTTFAYIYFHAQAGSGRALKDHYPGLSENNDAIRTALVTLNSASTYDVMTITTTPAGTIGDPSGQTFYGFRITVTVRERINA
jgi:hypothetical protein